MATKNVILNDPNGNGDVNGQIATGVNGKPATVEPKVVQPTVEPAKPVIPTSPAPVAPTPVASKTNIAVDNGNGKVGGQLKTENGAKPAETPKVETPKEVDEKPNNTEIKDSSTSTNKKTIKLTDNETGNGTTSGDLKIPSQGKDDSSIPQDTVKSVKYGDSSIGATSTAQNVMNSALLSRVLSEGSQERITNIAAVGAFGKDSVAGNSQFGGFGVVTGQALNENTAVVLGVNAGGIKQDGKSGIAATVQAGVHRKVSNNTTVGIDGSASFNGAAQTKKDDLGNVVGTTAKASAELNLTGQHKINDKLSVNAQVGAMYSKFDNGDSKTYGTAKLGANYVSDNGWNIGGGIRASQYGRDAGIIVGKIVNTYRDTTEEIVQGKRAFMQTVKPTTETLVAIAPRFESPFQFDKDDLQKKQEYRKMTEIIATTKVASGNTYLQEIIKQGAPIEITAAADAYDSHKPSERYNEKLSQRRANALYQEFINELKTNHQKYGVTLEEIDSLKITVKGLGDSQAKYDKEAIKAEEARVAKDHPKWTKDMVSKHVQNTVTHVDRYSAISVDIANSKNPEAFKAPVSVAENMKNQFNALGVKTQEQAYTTQSQTVEQKMVDMGTEKVGSVKLNSKGEIKAVYDADGNKVTDPQQKQALMQHYHDQKNNTAQPITSAFDNNALSKAVAGQQTIDNATQMQNQQPALEQDSQKHTMQMR